MKEVTTPSKTEGEAARDPAARQRRGRFGRLVDVPALHREKAVYGALFVVPALLIYLVFMIYPFLNTIYLSFTNWNGIAPDKEWVGLSNYVDRKSTRLNSSHANISYAVFCLKKKKNKDTSTSIY